MTTQTETPQSKALPRPLVKIMAIVMLGALMIQLDLTMTIIATRTWLRDFHTTLSVLQWTATGYSLAMAVTIPLAGWALERFGARTVWLTCIGLFLTGSVLCGIAWSPGSLIAFRVLQGLGGGMVLPIGQAVLVQTAGPGMLGRVMAALGVPAMLGPVLGPVLGGVLVDDLSWRWIFFVNVPVCLAAMALSGGMPARRAEGDSRLDLVGLLLLSPGSAAIVYGLAQTSSYGGFGSWHVLVPIVLGGLLLAGFAVNALRTTRVPLIDLRLFGKRAYASASASMFASGFVLFSAMAVLPLYYQIARGYSAQHAGLLLIPLGVGMGTSLAVGGRLVDKIAPRTIALGGLGFGALGTLAYTQVGAHTSLVLLGFAQVVSGLGIGATLVPIMTSAFIGLAPAAVPRASSSVRIMQQLGASFGSATLLIITQNQLSHHAPAAAFATTFWWVLAFAVVMLIPVLFLPGGRQSNDS
jgi:EmrB/QacA subfamily drug resistance transporter